MGIWRAVKWGVGLWFGGVALILVIAMLITPGPEEPSEPPPKLTPAEVTALAEKFNQRKAAHWNSEDGRQEAFYMSHEFVKKRLKAPSTADFPSYRDSGVEVRHKGEGVFLVKGYVDAQNAFGAKLRSAYLCELKDNGDKTWSAISVVLQ